MIIELVERFLSNPNIKEWSISPSEILKEFSTTEKEVILNTLSATDGYIFSDFNWA